MELPKRIFLEEIIYDTDDKSNLENAYACFEAPEGFEEKFDDGVIQIVLSGDAKRLKVGYYYKVWESSERTPYKMLTNDGEIYVKLRTDIKYTDEQNEELKATLAEIERIRRKHRHTSIYIAGNDITEIQNLRNKIYEWFDNGAIRNLDNFADKAGLDNPQNYHCNGRLLFELGEAYGVGEITTDPYPALYIATRTDAAHPMIRMWIDIAKKYAPNCKVYFDTYIDGEKSSESNDIDMIFFAKDDNIIRGEFPNME